jgi:hypothetical protein
MPVRSAARPFSVPHLVAPRLVDVLDVVALARPASFPFLELRQDDSDNG